MCYTHICIYAYLFKITEANCNYTPKVLGKVLRGMEISVGVSDFQPTGKKFYSHSLLISTLLTKYNIRVEEKEVEDLSPAKDQSDMVQVC